MIKNIFIVCLTFVSSHAFGQENDFWSEVEGKWSGKGQLFGAPASFEMAWAKALGNKFVKLQFKNSFERNGQSYEMSAMAMYQISTDSISGTWFDSRGQILPLKSELKGSVLTTYWGDEKTEKGKTIYSLESNDSIKVQDFVLREGDFQLFGEATYERD